MGEFEGKGILRFAQGDTDFMGFAGMGFFCPNYWNFERD